MTLARIQHWETRALHEFLLARAAMPFAWGSNDCALFAADGILAMTGVDIAADFRGKYSDESSALLAIKSVCGGSTVADAAVYCAEKHGLPEWPRPLFAQRGDLVVFQNGASAAAGLVHLSGKHVAAVGENGLYRVSITSVVRAWHA